MQPIKLILHKSALSNSATTYSTTAVAVRIRLVFVKYKKSPLLTSLAANSHLVYSMQNFSSLLKITEIQKTHACPLPNLS